MLHLHWDCVRAQSHLLLFQSYSSYFCALLLSAKLAVYDSPITVVIYLTFTISCAGSNVWVRAQGVTSQATRSPGRRVNPADVDEEVGSKIHTATPGGSSQPEKVQSKSESQPHLHQPSKRDGDTSGLSQPEPLRLRSCSLNTLDTAGSLPNQHSYSRQDTGYSSGGQSDSLKRQPEEHSTAAELQLSVSLERREDSDFVKLLARLIPNWQLLAQNLNFSQEEIHEIEENHAMREEQCYQMLKKWSERYREEATYAVLHTEVRNMHRGDLDMLILQHVHSLAAPVPPPLHEKVDIELIVGDNHTPIDSLPHIIRGILQGNGFTHATVKVVGHNEG